MYELSVIIPSRREMFLAKTVECILKAIRGNTEIIVVLDGALADPGIPDNDRVTLIYNHDSIGQRAATNQAVRMSKAKYVMKIDAHCNIDEGFDVKLMKDMQDDWTVVPIMYNLYGFDWVCPDGHKRYQGPSGPCKECKKPTTRNVVWKPRLSRKSTSYCFDSTPHFQYFGDYKKIQDKSGSNLVETMSLQGSCFMLTRDKYIELNICDEAFGSWGSQGIEIACKTWLSGGKVIVNKNTWYSHLFRTQGADFGFPYPMSGKQQEHAKKYAKDLFFNNKWDKQIHPLSWLLEKFYPIKGWDDKQLLEVKMKDEEFYKRKPKKGIIFYTDNALNLHIAHPVQRQLRSIGLPITSCSLKPMPKMGKNIVINRQRGYETLFIQILTALENSDADIIFFCEHDCLYHKTNFDFTPPTKDKFYYNMNWYKIREDGTAVTWQAEQVSGICVYRQLAIDYYKKRIELFNSGKFDRKFEPMSGEGSEQWSSKFPMLDIRHGKNLTYSKWKLEDFRNKLTAKNFKLCTIKDISGWDFSKGWLKPIALQ